MLLRRVGMVMAGVPIVGTTALAIGLGEEGRDEAIHAMAGGTRFLRTAGNVIVTAADYKWNLPKEKDHPDYKKILAEINLRAAKRLFQVCKLHGGLYTKFGQNVANMNNILPKEFTETLSPLQDKATPIPGAEALMHVEQLLGKPVSDVFDHFDEKAVAAASLAQVHRAVLKTGDVVAVKLQYPHLETQVRGDLAALKYITRLIGTLFPDFSYCWLTPEFERNMALELDFVQEGRNGERLGRQFHNRMDVYVPKIHWDLTNRKLLVMEFIDGIKATHVDELRAVGINPLSVASTISAIFGDMIHVHGFVHCDPHPGNLMVRPLKTDESKRTSILSYMRWLSIPIAVTVAAVAGVGSAIGIVSVVSSLGLHSTSFVSSSWNSGGSKTRTRYEYQHGGQPFEVVILDHGMYRRLDPSFRKAYCGLWQAVLLRDTSLGKQVAASLGLTHDQYEALSLIFSYHRGDPNQKHPGNRMSPEHRAQIRAKYKNVTAADVNQFFQGLPRDVLFVLRSTNIVRAINLSLGGTTRERFKIMGESAVRGLLIPNPTESEILHVMKQHEELDYEEPYSLNIPVASEVINADVITWHQTFQMWKLRTYLTLIDRSWMALAFMVKGL